MVLAALGIGGVGVASALGRYRPYMLAGTAAFLAAGFYFTYRRPRVAHGDACGCEPPRAKRAGRVGLWIAAVLVVLVAGAPPIFARWAVSAHGSTGTLPDNLEKVTFEVPGIDCEACAAPMRAALTKVGGLHDLRLDIPAQSVTVAYEPTPGRVVAYLNAINDLGYETKLHERSEAK